MFYTDSSSDVLITLIDGYIEEGYSYQDAYRLATQHKIIPRENESPLSEEELLFSLCIDKGKNFEEAQGILREVKSFIAVKDYPSVHKILNSLVE